MTDDLREAIGLMTAWNDDRDAQGLQTEYIAQINDPSYLMSLLRGLTGVAGMLLIKRREEMAVPEAETLSQLAAEVVAAESGSG